MLTGLSQCTADSSPRATLRIKYFDMKNVTSIQRASASVGSWRATTPCFGFQFLIIFSMMDGGMENLPQVT